MVSASLKLGVLYALIAIILAIGVFLNLILGEVKIPYGCLFRCGDPKYTFIIYYLRAPATLASIIVGYILGASGAVMQGILRNPLAEPYTTGVAGAAVVGGLLGYLLSVLGKLTGLWAYWSIPILALVMALAASAVVIGLGSRLGIIGLVLVGVLITLLTYVASMIIMMLIEYVNPSITIQPLYVLYGNLTGLTWRQVMLIAASFTTMIPASTVMARYVDLLMLGDDVAKASGINPVSARRILVALISIPLSVSLAFTGVIGFVGIVSPYAARHMTGRGSGRVIVPLSGVIGSLTLTYAYLASRIMISNYVLPITAVTGLIGIPMLIWIVARGGYGAST